MGRGGVVSPLRNPADDRSGRSAEWLITAQAPTPPPIPPSRGAARAALAALVERFDAGDDPASAVADSRLGAAAAASTCWSRTPLPRQLADVLRQQAVQHIRDAGAAIRV